MGEAQMRNRPRSSAWRRLDLSARGTIKREEGGGTAEEEEEEAQERRMRNTSRNNPYGCPADAGDCQRRGRNQNGRRLKMPRESAGGGGGGAGDQAQGCQKGAADAVPTVVVANTYAQHSGNNHAGESSATRPG